MKIIKNNYKFIITVLLMIIVLNINLPYYVYAPGGIKDISSKIELDGYKGKGSFNLTYVREYDASVSTIILSIFNREWEVVKKEEVLLDTEDNKAYQTRDKILLEESISNAIYIAYKKAGKSIDIKSNKLLVAYIFDKSTNDLEVGDEIVSINNKKVHSRLDIANIIDTLNIGDRLDIKVKRDNKEYNKYALVVDDEGNKKIGILVSTINEYVTDPKVNVIVDKNESGSSGGLVTALYIYNSLVEEDITKGLTIVGTGTIELDGSIGSIGGVAHKLKSAEKAKADLFIVPNDENYDEALKLKKKNNYKIKIIGVSTFDEVIEYLKK